MGFVPAHPAVFYGKRLPMLRLRSPEMSCGSRAQTLKNIVGRVPTGSIMRADGFDPMGAVESGCRTVGAGPGRRLRVAWDRRVREEVPKWI